MKDVSVKLPCQTGDPERFFPVSEDSSSVRRRVTKPPEDVRDECMNRCPLQAECLAIAIREDRVGIWGGTTYSQRKVLARNRRRVHCVRCEGIWSVQVGETQICLACGISWKSPLPAPPSSASPSAVSIAFDVSGLPPIPPPSAMRSSQSSSRKPSRARLRRFLPALARSR